jgi:hypothetical protein
MLDMYGTTLGRDGISADERNSLYHMGPHQGTVVVPKLLHLCVIFPLHRDAVRRLDIFLSFAICSNCIHDPVFYESPDWSNPEMGLTKRWGPAVLYSG